MCVCVCVCVCDITWPVLQGLSESDTGGWRSYLGTPRIHFAGYARADTFTVNNFYRNYDIDNFHIIYEAVDLWQYADFNAKGTGAFDFYDTHVTSVCETNGVCEDNNPLVGVSVETAMSAVSGKLVGTDFENYLGDTLYGMTFGLRSYGHSAPLLSGRLPVLPFRSIARNVAVDSPFAPYHHRGSGRVESILEDVEWNNDLLEKYESLKQLRNESNGVLSVSFMTYGYVMDATSPINNTYGFIVGTLGPGSRDPPIGRRSLQSPSPVGNQNGQGQFELIGNGALVTVDFGTAMRYRYVNGDYVVDVDQLGDRLCLRTSSSDLEIGVIDLSGNWYQRTAGVQTLNPGKEVVKALQGEYLHVKRCRDNSTFLVEPQQDVRSLSTTPVFMNPGDSYAAKILVTRRGYPLSGHRLPVQVLLASKFVPKAKEQKALDALKVNGRNTIDITTDDRGEASFAIEAGNPGNPRGIIDGCPFHVRFVPEEDDLFSDSKFSVRVFDEFIVESRPTWFGEKGIYNIFKQYYYNYPVMRRVLNLVDYTSVTNPRERSVY